MLIRFAVENFKSFKNETCFEMLATDEPTMCDHVHSDDENYSTKTLPISVLFGMNGGGKTNLLSAIDYAVGCLEHGVAEPSSPCRLEAGYDTKPSKFAFTFKTGGTVYGYEFAINREMVEKECLYVRFTDDEELETVFERTDVDGQAQFSFGNVLNDCDFEELLKKPLPGHILLLSVLCRKHETLNTAYTWLTESVYVHFSSDLSALDVAVAFLQAYKKNKEWVSEKLSEAGVGIASIESAGSDHDCSLLGRPGDDLFIKYVTQDGSEMRMSCFQESSGIQQLIKVLSWLDYGDPDNTDEKVIFIDDFDLDLHPLLSLWLLQLCSDIALKSQGKYQVILTTHNTRLMNKNLLRSDEIWLAERRPLGDSVLTGLSDYKLEGFDDYEKAYLEGRFGAVPQTYDLTNYDDIYDDINDT